MSHRCIDRTSDADLAPSTMFGMRVVPFSPSSRLRFFDGFWVQHRVGKLSGVLARYPANIVSTAKRVSIVFVELDQVLVIADVFLPG